MSFPATIDTLLNHEVKENFITSLLKNSVVSHEKREKILEKLVFMRTFEEISQWVSIHSQGERYIANPSSIANDEDRNSCLNELQELIARAIKGQGDRKNGRDIKLKRAAEISDFATIARVLASSSGTYWRNRGFFSKDKKSRQKRVIISQLQNDEKNQKKKDFQKALINNIGAAVDFKKAQKKGAFQEVLDFFETEEILKNEDFEV